MRLLAGTRPSQLAQRQTETVCSALVEKNPQLEITAKSISTTGDRNQSSERKVEDKREWIREIEEAILCGEVDFAIHSAKDVPVIIAPETRILPVLKRASAADVFVSGEVIRGKERVPFLELARGSRLGTCSLRRKAQLLRIRPDFNIVELRGNVDTRLKKLAADETLAGAVLARAGLSRLGRESSACETFDPEVLLPAVNQGILVVQYLTKRTDLQALFRSVRDELTELAFTAERECVTVLEADCNSAVSVYAELAGEEISLKARVLSVDGSECLESSYRGQQSECIEIGRKVARDLIALGASRLL